ncbi:MAG: hypothetical protein PHE79_11530 [Eubacteriales bacterium]|nr:hypothetical protein [Eubacteriales bacterium]
MKIEDQIKEMQRLLENCQNQIKSGPAGGTVLGYDVLIDREAAYQAIIKTLEDYSRLRKAFALACRILADSTGANDRGKDIRATLLEAAESDQICRVCGCTQDNACPGGCYWVEEDLCSACEGEL